MTVLVEGEWHDADAREEEALCKYVNKHRCILSVL